MSTRDDPEHWDAATVRRAERARLEAYADVGVIAENQEAFRDALLREFTRYWVHEWLLPATPDSRDVHLEVTEPEKDIFQRLVRLTWHPETANTLLVGGPHDGSHMTVTLKREHPLRLPMPPIDRFSFHPVDEVPIPDHPDLIRLSVSLGNPTVFYEWAGWHPKHRAWVRKVST